MIDIAAKREANRRKLLGEDAADGKVFVPYTKVDCTNAEVCWDIISIVTRKEQVEKKGRGGSTYMAEGKELMFPNLLPEVEVGARKGSTKDTKDKVYSRTNIQTMDEMYSVRNAMARHAVDDIDDEYSVYFTSLVELLDAYACDVVADIILDDEKFLDRVNEARKPKKDKK